MVQPIKLGTRASKLAVTQANLVKAALIDHTPNLEIELIQSISTGDKILDRSLAESGGKGLFCKELDEALLADHIDFAVHSLKDVETQLPEGLTLYAVLPREDPRDALVFPTTYSPPFLNRFDHPLNNLAKSAIIGTASVRRQAQLTALRPDLSFKLIRGNLPTRLKKLEEEGYNATLLAMAGLKRLGIDGENIIPLEPEQFLPAAGQGAIAIIGKEDCPQPLKTLVTAINHTPTFTSITAERAVLEVLDGSCRTPIAAHATIKNKELTVNAMMAAPDGRLITATKSGSMTEAHSIMEAQAIGNQAGKHILAQL